MRRDSPCVGRNGNGGGETREREEHSGSSGRCVVVVFFAEKKPRPYKALKEGMRESLKNGKCFLNLICFRYDMFYIDYNSA